MRENETEGEKRGGGEKRGRNLLLGSIRASRRNTLIPMDNLCQTNC